jgi:hypothetical protein
MNWNGADPKVPLVRQYPLACFQRVEGSKYRHGLCDEADKQALFRPDPLLRLMVANILPYPEIPMPQLLHRTRVPDLSSQVAARIISLLADSLKWRSPK